MGIKKTIADHVKWLRGEDSGAHADLTGADLTGADLTDADLTGAVLTRADLTGADLRGADLTDADLTRADLTGAVLTDAVLTDADLTRADLRGADLTDADLTGADLRGAVLTDAVLTDADLTRADQLALARTLITPEGDLIAWKRAGEHIVKLKVPADARRSNATGRKCRAEWVEVLEIQPTAEVAVTDQHGPLTEYRVGQIVKADSWDENRWNECSHGIHFFLTRQEAEAWA